MDVLSIPIWIWMKIDAEKGRDLAQRVKFHVCKRHSIFLRCGRFETQNCLKKDLKRHARFIFLGLLNKSIIFKNQANGACQSFPWEKCTKKLCVIKTRTWAIKETSSGHVENKRGCCHTPGSLAIQRFFGGFRFELGFYLSLFLFLLFLSPSGSGGPFPFLFLCWSVNPYGQYWWPVPLVWPLPISCSWEVCVSLPWLIWCRFTLVHPWQW